jgi:hypothetical protein
MKKYLLPSIIALSALSVSISAAFYSVTGLSMLFAGASVAVLIMASSLEVAKLVIASLLYQYWNKLNKVLRIYLTVAACVLVLITSAGIYGFLSSAYQSTATKSEIVDKQIAALETKKHLYEDSRNSILKEKQSLADLKGTLSKGSTTQFTDRNGNLVVRSNKASINQIDQANKSDEKLSSKVDIVNDSIFSLENQILAIKVNSDATSELGPLKYISKLTGQPMDKIINWFLLVIIFVFDPLAISLVIAANFAFTQIRKDPTPKEDEDWLDELNDEDREWLENNLEEETNIEWDEYGNPSPIIDEEPNEKLKQAATEYKKQTGVPVMVDPKTGKFYYEEPDFIQQSEARLDLDGDGVVEEDEIKHVFDQADTNDDGIIDENEAKQANLDQETTDALNKANEIFSKIDDSIYYPNIIQEELPKLKQLVSEYLTKKKDDDNTITYF